MRNVCRQEKKFLVDLASSKAIENRVSLVMHGDKHNRTCEFCSGYPVRSLYFDTLHDRDFAEKLAGLDPRRKVRLRVYDLRAEFALLELKQKHGNNQQKRSLPVTREQAGALINGNFDALLSISNPFATEMHGLMSANGYMPKAIVEYDRAAYEAPGCNTRVTFDRNIRATEFNYNIFDEKLCTYPVLDPFNTVVEVKFTGTLPSYVKAVLGCVDKSETAVSKYCLARAITQGYQF